MSTGDKPVYKRTVGKPTQNKGTSRPDASRKDEAKAVQPTAYATLVAHAQAKHLAGRIAEFDSSYGEVPGNGMLQPKTRFVARHYLTPASVKYLEKHAPHVQFVPGTRPAFHPHPLLNIDRERAETMAYQILRSYSGHDDAEMRVVDIGGNPVRHHRQGRASVHSCCPTLSPEDEVRFLRNVGAPNWCTHRAEDCQCVEVPHAYLSVDSLYYMTPTDVAELVARSASKVLVAVVHEFPEAFGSFAAGEATYQQLGPEMVSMHVNGNSTPYVHSNLHWMRAGHHRVMVTSSNGSEYRSLVWSKQATTTDHAIYVFTISRKVYEHADHQPVLAAALTDTSYYGKVLTGALSDGKATVNTPGEYIHLPDVSVHSFGPWMMLYRATNDVAMHAPKSLVAEAALYMMGRARTADSFTVLLNHVRHSCKKVNLPPALMAQSAFAAACLAFVQNVEFEVATMHGIVKPALKAMGVHSDAMTFKFKHVWTWKHLAAAAAATSMVAVSLASFGIVGAAAATTAVAAAVGVACLSVPRATSSVSFKAKKLAEMAVSQIRAGQAHREYLSKRATYRGPDRVVPMEVPLLLPSTDPATKLEELLVAPVDKTVTMDVPDPVERKETNVITVAGLVSTHNTPIVASASAHSVVSALVERGGKEQPYHTDEFDPALFAEFETFVFDNFDELFNDPKGSVVTATPFDTWNARFPLGQQRVQRKAHHELNVGTVRETTMHKRKIFVKVESMLKASPDGVKTFKPRQITGATAHYQALTGPWVHAFSAWLKEHWNLKFPLKYATSGDSLELGDAAMAALEKCIAAWAEGDFSMFDTTIHEKLLEMEIRIFARLGCPARVLAAMREAIKLVGFANFHIFFEVFGTRKSGDPQTSCGNTMLQILAVVFCLWKAASVDRKRELSFIIKNLEYFGLGDDNLIGLTDRLYTPTLIPVVQRLLGRIGLRFKPKVHEGDTALQRATFCSSRFYPVLRADGSQALALAPCLGRVYSKIGHYCNARPGVDVMSLVRGDAMSRVRDYAAIPFLSDIVNVMLRCTKGLASVAPKDDAAYRHHASEKCTMDPQVWSMLLEVYGLTPAHHQQYAKMLSTVRTLPCVVDFEPLLRAAQIDGVVEDGVVPAGFNHGDVDEISDAQMATFFQEMHDDEKYPVREQLARPPSFKPDMRKQSVLVKRPPLPRHPRAVTTYELVDGSVQVASVACG